MKHFQLVTLLELSLVSAISVNAQDVQQVQLSVNAKMDIYRAGGFNDGSDGVAPVKYSFSARAGRILEFSSVTGTWTCDPNSPPFGPDGITAVGTGCNPPDYIAGPVGTFSGFDAIDFVGPMVGMFLEDTLPTAAPAPGRFYVYDKSQGGIETNFAALAPKIGQVFFIGDGLRGTGVGRTQAFVVPATATRLYLGFVDSCANPTPSCYSDNTGTLTATFGLYNIE